MIELADSGTAANLREIVEDRVRAEHEPRIQEEVKRRMGAVEMALSGGIEAPAPPPPRRKPRSDKGSRRPRIAVDDEGGEYTADENASRFKALLQKIQPA